MPDGEVYEYTGCTNSGRVQSAVLRLRFIDLFGRFLFLSCHFFFTSQLPRRASARPTPAMIINPPAVRKTD